MPKSVLAGAVLGTGWSVLAVGIYLAMITGHLPTPGEVALPIGVGLTLLYAPFIGAIALEVLVGRASPTFGELVVVALLLGILAGVAVAKGFTFSRRAFSRRRAK